MNVPGAYQLIPTIPNIISISANLSHKSDLVGRTIEDTEKRLSCRIVMVECEDEDGLIKILSPDNVDTLSAGNKVLIFLQRDDLKRVEKVLEI